MKPFFITTAIDYPNALPHNGTAFEKIGADIQARFHRFNGHQVHFLMGNDENTVKVIREDTKKYVDDMADRFRSTWRALHVQPTDFIQTSEKRHRAGVQKFIQGVFDAGYIYKKPYTAPYCEGCEEFKTLKSLENGRCPNHQNQAISQVTEENWFFRLSAFRDQLLKYYETADIRPESRLNEVRKFVKSDLEDMSISRANRGWGIPVPFDQSQTVYVWFDALLNYMTAAGFGTDDEKFNSLWPADVHVIGKDITRFHCALWPAMIWAYNEKAERKIELPRQVFAHGFIYRKKDSELVKESKSDPDAVKLTTLLDEYGTDAYRYYFMSRCSFDGDGEYTAEHFREVYNADLANNLGNLLSRLTNMVVQYCGGVIPESDKCKTWMSLTYATKFKNATLEWNFREGLDMIWEILRRANEYCEHRKPWAQAKEDKEACVQTLIDVASALHVTSLMLKAYLPNTSEKIYKSLGFKDWDQKTFGDVCAASVSYLPEIRTQKIQPIFPRK